MTARPIPDELEHFNVEQDEEDTISELVHTPKSVRSIRSSMSPLFSKLSKRDSLPLTPRRPDHLPLLPSENLPLLFIEDLPLEKDPVRLLRKGSHVSLEKLNPDPECTSRKSTVFVAMINLVATVCGGGVLSLPLAFARAGILPTTFLMIFGAVATDFCLYLLVACARRTGGRSYGDVAQAAFGSFAQVVTTVTLASELLGTLIAYQVLVKDVWGQVVFTLFPLHHQDEDSQDQDQEQGDRMASNMLLGGILLAAFPLLLKKDLHALRHTCYVGFSSCVLLMLAVVYRAAQTLPRSSESFAIKWYSTDPADILFAFPIVTLSFFCSYNVLGVHSCLVQPTRRRIRAVLDASLLVCFLLFYLVGLGGYLYAGDATLDNIILNFPIDDKAILAGRSGFCLTLMFGLPLVLLPCREAIVSIPKQIEYWRKNHDLAEKYEQLPQERKVGAHLIINGVDFDGNEPVLLLDGHMERHGTKLKYYGGTADSSKTDTASTSNLSSEDLTDEVSQDEKQEDAGSSCWERTIRVVSTVVILLVTYTAAILVPGVASVWSIIGSSMAIWISYIVPIGCYLKIREHKGATIRSIAGGLLLVFSCLAAVVCTRQAVISAMEPAESP